MDCTICQELINPYMDEDLEDQLWIEMNKHLGDCADCSNEVADWETCLRSLRETFPEQSPPEMLWERIQTKTKTQ